VGFVILAFAPAVVLVVVLVAAVLLLAASIDVSLGTSWIANPLILL
jgi:hypothetical protein